MASVDDKDRLLKEIDKDFSIEFNKEIESYIIYHNGYHFQTVKYGDFTRELLGHIREMVYININGDPMKHIDESNTKVEIAREKETDDMIEQTVKDIAKPMWELFR